MQMRMEFPFLTYSESERGERLMVKMKNEELWKIFSWRNQARFDRLPRDPFTMSRVETLLWIQLAIFTHSSGPLSLVVCWGSWRTIRKWENYAWMFTVTFFTFFSLFLMPNAFQSFTITKQKKKSRDSNFPSSPLKMERFTLIVSLYANEDIQNIIFLLQLWLWSFCLPVLSLFVPERSLSFVHCSVEKGWRR